MMTITAFLILSVFALGNSWILDANKNSVINEYSSNLTIHCYDDGQDKGHEKLKHILRMRILKYEDGNKWKTVAKVTDLKPVVNSSLNVRTSGKAGDPSNSFIQIHFDVVRDYSFGYFKCEVNGYDINDEFVTVKTTPCAINERSFTYKDISDIVSKLKTNKTRFSDSKLSTLERAVKDLQNKTKQGITAMSRITTYITSMIKKYEDLNIKLQNTEKRVDTELKIIGQVYEIEQQAWPEGSYALLNTSNGCPTSYTFEWETSEILIATQAGTNNTDDASVPMHLTQPLMEHDSGNNHFFHLRLCSKRIASAGPSWPKGSFCLNPWGNQCPANFVYNVITLDRENLLYPDMKKNLESAVYNRDVDKISFCCRKDGNPDTPILLPAKNPFYLYRFGGRCQQVIGMDVSSEWILLDTKEVKDAYSDADHHPDGHLKDVKVELCYYTPAATRPQ